jgi:selenocysteine lyase/cysteine desulfurase
MRAYFATVMLHDALPTGNNNGHARNLTKIRADYGIVMRTVSFTDEGDVQTRQGLRISSHIYTNYDQIDLLARAIEENLGMM